MSLLIYVCVYSCELFLAFCFSGKLKIKDKSNAYYSATNTTNICS